MDITAGLEHYVRADEPLAPYTWLQLGGTAQFFAEPNNLDELVSIVKRCHDAELPIRLLGGGSNLLVRDAGVPGLVVALTHPTFCGISVDGTQLKAGGGARLSHVVSTSVGHGLAGLETMAGLPGTLGGALHDNAGANGVDIGQRTVEATVVTRMGEVMTRSPSELQFTYRQSSLDELAIISATLELDEVDSHELTRRMQKFWIVQKASQPGGVDRMCYLFVDPPGATANSLIEQAGLKGTKVGGAEACPEHPNYVLVSSDATADDVLRLAELVQSRVKEYSGVELRRQITVW